MEYNNFRKHDNLNFNDFISYIKDNYIQIILIILVFIIIYIVDYINYFNMKFLPTSVPSIPGVPLVPGSTIPGSNTLKLNKPKKPKNRKK
jgi:hypothetical protein